MAVVDSRLEAELIVGLLRSNGLWAAVSADDVGGQEPQLQRQGVRVLVTEDEESAARGLLADVAGAAGKASKAGKADKAGRPAADMAGEDG